jgi:amino acid transporter
MSYDAEKANDLGHSDTKQSGVVYGTHHAIAGAATVAEAEGLGGNTHRGLKSRHIQFMYVF